jgi:hypothetical protein
MEERVAQIQACMYQYSRAIYRSIKDLIDPYVDPQTQLEYRRAVLTTCEQTMERLAKDPHYFANPGSGALPGHQALFPDHVSGSGCLGGQQGRVSGGRVHPGADRRGRLRRRRRTVPRDDAQGQAVPADAAAGARLLPVAPASRPLPRSRLVSEGTRSRRRRDESRGDKKPPKAAVTGVSEGTRSRRRRDESRGDKKPPKAAVTGLSIRS